MTGRTALCTFIPEPAQGSSSLQLARGLAPWRTRGYGPVMENAPELGALRVYLLLLPDPIPVHPGSTWTRELDLPAPELEGAMFAPAQHLSPIESEGRNFVSLKFWQIPSLDTDPFHPIKVVLDAITGHETKGVNATSSSSTSTPLYQTVVEAVTYVDTHPEGENESDDDLTRCIEVLLSYHRAYRLTTQAVVPELTYERLHPIVMCLERALVEDEPPSPMGITMLNHLNIPGTPPSPLTEPDNHRIGQVAARVGVTDPFMLYMDRKLDAALEADVNGRPGESVVQSAIAAEVLLDTTLGLLMWEEFSGGRISTADAATVFSTDLMPRIGGEFHPRLGGTWALTSQTISPWHLDIATVRGRVVHAGYRPSIEEAHAARKALVTLERFIGDRLAMKFKTYPKSAWLFLGHAGFEKRGRLKSAEKWVEANLAEPVSTAQLEWLRAYRIWREQVNAQVQRRQRRPASQSGATQSSST